MYRIRIENEEVEIKDCFNYLNLGLSNRRLVQLGEILSNIENSQTLTHGDEYLEDYESLWQDIFIYPDFQTMLTWYDMQFNEHIIIPFLYTLLSNSPLYQLHPSDMENIHSLSETLEYAANFGRHRISIQSKGHTAMFNSAVEALANTQGGEEIVISLPRETVNRKFEKLLPESYLQRETDYVEYIRDNGSAEGIKQCLILPSFVRNRIHHPENRHYNRLPNRSVIRRATALIYATSLILRINESDRPKLATHSAIHHSQQRQSAQTVAES